MGIIRLVGKERIVLHDAIDFGADSGMKEGELWYFAFADEEHCAIWTYHDEWTGDSYRNVTGTDYQYMSDVVIQH